MGSAAPGLAFLIDDSSSHDMYESSQCGFSGSAGQPVYGFSGITGQPGGAAEPGCRRTAADAECPC